MENLIQYQKPELIVLAEKTKLKDYPEEKRNNYVKLLITKLLNLLGVNEGKNEIHNALALHIIAAYKNVTFEQIDKAFELFISGAFSIKPFQQLNAVVFGNVMAEYFLHEKEQTKIYKLKLAEFKQQAKPMSEDDKTEIMEIAIKEAIEIYRETGHIELSASKYDYLYSKGLLQGSLSKEDFNALKRLKYESVKNRLIAVYSEMKADSLEEKKEHKNILEEIQEKVSGTVVYQCKFEMLEDYFKTKL